MIKAVSAVLVISLLLCTFAACNTSETENYEKEFDVELKKETTTELVYELPEDVNPLTGMANLSEGAKGKRPVAIMVADAPEARPQWGMMTPDLTVEGLIGEDKMGMMWVYGDYTKIPNQVGPIAPANDGFAELAQGMNALYIHWDGETGEDVDSIDGGMYQGTYFFNDSSKNQALEYQRATSKAYIESAISTIGFEMSFETAEYAPYQIAFEGGEFSRTYDDNSGLCGKITIDFLENLIYSFQYNKDSKCYQQYINNELVVDENGNPRGFDNVIYLFVKTETVNGEVKWVLDTEERGTYVSRAYGQRIMWKVDSETGALKLYDTDGETPLIINSGNVWLGIVPNGSKVTVQ